MKILVINSGSSSIKFQLFQMKDRRVLVSGIIERIGEPLGGISFEIRGGEKRSKKEKAILNHATGLKEIVGLLENRDFGIIEKLSEISAIGHRVVHGGETFHEPTIITGKVLEAVEEHARLAPLHNPVNLVGIEAAFQHFKDIPQVAVFDTAFHQSIPAHAFHYAVPASYYKDYGIRRYGFHGTSHFYIAKEYARYLNCDLENLNLVTVHLGNGASMTAIEKGKSIDTSMGMTPLEGLIMGTRSGDIDPAIHFFLKEHLGLDFVQIEKVLNKESGLRGICGSNDMRDILAKTATGDSQAQLAVAMYSYRIKKYIGAYLAALGGAHAVIFTGGIGENSPVIREKSLMGLDFLGIKMDPEKNNLVAVDEINHIWRIHADDSKVHLMVIGTNEELEIANQVLEVLSQG